MTMTETQQRAKERFDRMWESEKAKLVAGEVVPATMKDGETDPVDFCISTIARLVLQPQGFEAIQSIKVALRKLFESASTQFIYPDESLHISLVGCTQREASTSFFSEDHIRNIDSICSSAIANHQYVDVVFKGIGIIGNQIFIQGMPITNGWEMLRTDVTHELESNGEQPISYPDKSPIHMNIIRITDASSEKLVILRDLIDQLRDIEIATVRFLTIELVITDFVVSKKNMTSLKEYSLKNLD